MAQQSNRATPDSCSDSSTSSSDSSSASHGQAPTPPTLLTPQQQQQQQHFAQEHKQLPSTTTLLDVAHTQQCEAKANVAVIPVSHLQGPELGFQPQPQDLSISLDFLKQSTQQAVQQQHQHISTANVEAPITSPWSPDDTPLEAAPSPHGRPFVARSRSSAPAPGSALARHAQSASLNFLVPSGGEPPSLTPPSPPYGSSVGSSAAPASVANFAASHHRPTGFGDERDASRQRSFSRDAQHTYSGSGSFNAARHALPWSSTSGNNGAATAELSPALSSSSPSSDYFLDQRQARADGAAYTSLALGRSASASRAQVPPIFAPWAAEEAWRSGEEAWQQQQRESVEGARPQSIMSDASRNQSRRPPFVGRSHSANVGMAFGGRSHSSSFEPGSPASFGGLESPGGRSATASSPHVGALPTMHEEWSFDAPLQSGSYATREDMAARASRHRSTSSAAAIPFHSSRGGGGGSMEHDAGAARTRSSSVWAGGASPAYASRYMGGSGAASLDELEDLGHDGDERSGDKTAMQSPVSRGRDYRAPGGPRLETDSSNTSPFVRDGSAALGRHYDDEELGAPHGSESRRHSISAAPGAGGAPLASRRAVGFEVAGQGSGASRTGSVGRHPSHMPSTSRAGGGYGLFGGGSLAITDDDLAADLNTLQLNLDHVAERQQEQEQAQASRQVSMRVPSSAAAATGAHAASMPPRFGEPSGVFDFASPHTGGHSPWSNTRGRTGEIAASWDLHTPAAASPTHHRDLRAMSVGGPFSARPTGQVRERSASNVSETSAAARSESKYTLSPRAKAFNIANMGAIGTGASPQGGFDQNLPAQSPSQAQFGAPLPYAPTTHRRNPSSAGSMNYPSQQQQQPLIRPAGLGTLQPLSDVAFASLASLGPMPMSSGGGGHADGPASLQELGKGVPLHTLPRTQPLYLCAFKADRTDIFFRQPTHPGAMPLPDGDDEIRKGDLVVVEGDRGKDIGTVVNCSITVEQVEHFLAHQNELIALAAAGKGDGTSAAGSGPAARQPRTINPKRLYYKATLNETSLLPSKAQDEERALQLIQTKVLQRGLPMQVVAAEFQWDHRKLTFYYHSTARVDFRELVKEVFRLYKTRIWMVNLNHGAT